MRANPTRAATILVPAIVLWLAGISWAHATEQSISLAGINVVVWSQPSAAGSRQPVLIFSHGFHGCATQNRFLMEAFASAGYLAFAPNHGDALCPGASVSVSERPQVGFRQPQAWNDSTYRDRADDIRRLVDAIRADVRFAPRVDWSRVALAGHSLGGYTVLGLAGAWPSWKLPGVKAVLALSPYSVPFLAHNTLGNISVPVMYQCGMRDLGIPPLIEDPDSVYDHSPAPKYYVQFEKGGHLEWADVGLRRRQAIVSYSVAFLNHYVKGEATEVLTQVLPGVAQVRYASELGTGAAAVKPAVKDRPAQ